MSLRILVAGIGNIFFGDDGFGVEVVHRLSALPENVTVADFGIRGFDLAFALTRGYDKVILVDAMQRDKPPGTVFLLEPDLTDSDELASPVVQTHGMHPLLVLQMAKSFGEVCEWIRIVGCEPATLGSEEEPVMGLSEPVKSGVAEAVKMIESLVADLCGTPA